MDRIRFFKCMDLINLTINKTNDFEMVIRHFLDCLLSIFSADIAFLVYPCDPGATLLRVRSVCDKSQCSTKEYQGATEITASKTMSEVCKKLIENNDQPVTFECNVNFLLSEELTNQNQFQRLMAMAIYPKVDKPWNLSIGLCSSPKSWNSEDKKLFQEIGRRFCDRLATLIVFRNLQESEARYRRIVDTTNEGIWMIDENNSTTYINKRIAEMLGYDIEDITNKNSSRFMFDEDVSDHYKRIETQKKGISEIYERRFRCKNGKTLWALLSATPIFDESKNYKGTFGMLLDITQRKTVEEQHKKKEEQLRITLETGNVGVWEWDVVNDLITATPVFYSMLGYEPKSETIKIKEWSDRLHPKDRDHVNQIYQRALSRDLNQYQYEARFRQPDGSYKWVLSKGFGFERDRNGLVTRLTGIRLDIDQRKLAEQEHLTTIRFFKSMNMVNQAISGTNDLEQMLSNVLDAMVSIFDADRTMLLYPCDPDAPTWRISMERAKPGFLGEIFLKNLEQPVTSAMSDMSQKLIDANGSPVTFGFEADYPLHDEFIKRFDFKSLISMAIYPNVGNKWNLSMQQCVYQRVWMQEDKTLFQEIGRRLTDGLTALLIFRDLQESERKYRRIIDTTSEGIWMLGNDGNTNYVNKRLTEMIGYNSDEILNRPPSDFMFKEDHSDLEKKKINRKMGLSEVYERRYRHKSGKTVWTLMSATPVIDYRGNFKGAFAMLSDITQRKIAEEKLKQSEERLRITLEAAKIGIWDWDLINNLVYVTPSSYSVLGYGPRYEPIPLNEWLAMMHSDDRKEAIEAIQDISKLNLTHNKGYEIRYKHADGQYRWMLSQGFIVNRDKDDKITRIVGVLINIDDRKKAEEQLKKYHERLEDLVSTRTKELSEANKQLNIAKEAAEAASKAKSRFLASMSHELRTPLNAILGYAQIFERDTTLSDNQKTGVEIIKSSGEHLLALISDILDLSRIEANKIELYPSVIDLRSFLESIKDVISIKVESKQISIQFKNEPNLPKTVLVDETRLRQVLLNLLSNAVKFTDSGYVICHVSVISCDEITEIKDDGLCTIRFEVKDTGTGMPSDQLEKIFMPFEQLKKISVKEGAGLGLAISRQLVQLMGGDIFVESELGKGSRFWFELALPVVSVSIPFKSSQKKILGYKGMRKKTLIVDDQQTNRQVLTEWFSQLGFDMSEAENGLQAISLVQQIEPDIIIMDIVMPELNGLDAALEIRKIPSASKILLVAISESSTDITTEQCKMAGFDDLLLKPIDFEKLLAVIKRYTKIEWVYEEGIEKSAEEILETVIPPPPEELKMLQKYILRGDMLQLNKRAQYIETLGMQYIPFARKLKLLTENFEERMINELIEDALRKQNSKF